jgi:hypothetical protein
LFKLKANPYRPEYTHFVHENCEKGKNADAVPARFLLACRNGHLDDFPWHWFTHGGPSDCKGTLRFFERGASLQTENLWVKCDQCGAARSLVHAFGKDAAANLPACRGRHPHLDAYGECSEEPRTILLGATNSWFPITLSVLAIPLGGNPLAQLILDGWTYFEEAESEAEIKAIVKTLTKSASLPGIDKWDAADIWNEVSARKDGKQTEIAQEGDIKIPEWGILTSDQAVIDWPHFMSRKIDVPDAYTQVLSGVLLLERLREVNALIGYTRVEAPEESMSQDERPPVAALSRGRPEWVPVSEVHGEGIFIRFDESEVSRWEKLPAVQSRSQVLEAGHRVWRTARRLDPDEGYPGIRYAMLHTFAHLLIRELALECGYNAASIRERIYAGSGDGQPMAGVLLYTAAADSDGTLGGLVELGQPKHLGGLIERALQRAVICSSDPLCFQHDPSKDRSLHLAACHACSFIAETSCERGNRYLDRALLVSTFGVAEEAAFFQITGSGNE